MQSGDLSLIPYNLDINYNNWGYGLWPPELYFWSNPS